VETRKRGENTHTSANDRDLRATSVSSEATAAILQNNARRRSESRTSDVLLQDATNSAAAVSQLANSIENRARSIRSRSVFSGDAAEDTEDESDSQRTRAVRQRSKRRQKRARDIEDIAEEVVQDAVGGKKRRRLSTPENAEEIEINPEEVSMGDLIEDNKVGRKSETEKRMRENWADIKQRRQEEIARRREAAGKGRHGRQTFGNPDEVAEDVHVPQQIIVNGQIVVAAESREVAFGAGVEQAVVEDADVALDDDRIYKYVNQGTVGKYAGLRGATRWNDENTELFYKGLRWFGTDFGMVSSLFPSLDRRKVKLKYMVELRTNGERVKECLAAKEPVNMEEYVELTEQVFVDPAELQAELDAEEKRLREEDKRKREQEGFINDDADIPIPTTERDGDEHEVGEGEAEQLTERGDRISAIADAVVAAAGAPKKRANQQRKTKEPVGRGRQSRKKARPIEGIEERLGHVDEVGR
jgi:hypothetical protein